MGSKKQRPVAGAWWVLLVLPALLVIVITIPSMGEHEEGLIPETIAAHLADTELFSSFAADARRWGAAIFGLSCLVGILIWWTARNGWRKRLLAFDARKASRYRAYIFGRLLLAMSLAVLLAIGLIFLSSSFRTLPLVSWVIIAAGAAAFAALQFLATVWGTTNTRRLVRGR